MKFKLFILPILSLLASCSNSSLPKPQVSSSYRGEQFGIDRNINEATIDKYLNRKDAVYRDMRMLIDPANYGEIDGDSYLSGFVKGFEVVPFPYIAPLGELPVSGAYSGDTLFSLDENNNYFSNYQESKQIIYDLFPQDKVIFLMCGGGGYAGMMKTFLINLGYDANKIYNVGGYWFYEGSNNVEVKRISSDKTYYDFYKVSYHDIDFSSLTKIER